MSELESLFQEIKESKEKDKQQFEKIKYAKDKNKLKYAEIPKFKSKIVEITSKDQVYEEMKSRFRSKWKNPAYVNKEFSSVPVLRNQGLTEWELFKAIQPDRTFYYPKGYHGFKTKYNGDYFREPPLSIYPKPFTAHLEKTQTKFKEFLMRPSKFGKISLDYKLEDLKLMNKEPFHLINTKNTNNFDFPKHNTWESELRKRKVLKPLKMS